MLVLLNLACLCLRPAQFAFPNMRAVEQNVQLQQFSVAGGLVALASLAASLDRKAETTAPGTRGELG